MQAAGGSNIGLRKDNEDRYEIRTISLSDGSALVVLVIADGMGGHEHGQLASRIAVEQFADLPNDVMGDGFRLHHMQTLFGEANAKIFARQEQLQDGIMGTTLTAVAIQADRLYLGHVGDSRCYIYRDGELIQISVDHTYYAELLRLGQTVSEQDEKQKNVLMRALGPELTVEGQYLEQTLRAQDMVVLCTDGLYNAVSMEDALKMLAQVQEGSVSAQQAVDQMLELALSHGARDNLTLVLYLHERTER